MGGFKPGSGVEPTVLRDCMMIDANLTVYEREPMKNARYGAPLAMIRDRFILVLGGMTGKIA